MLKITGNGHVKELLYDIPEWIEDKDENNVEAYFLYHGDKYFLSEFMRTNSPELLKKGINGTMGTSHFSAIGISLSDDIDGVKVYYITW